MKLLLKNMLAVVFFFVGGALLIFPQTVHSQENIAGTGYTYKIIKPKNQIGSAGYFDLRMTPGQQQTVEIEFYNMTDQDLSVDLSVHSAKTNSNGVIEYGPTKLKNDPSLAHDIKEIVDVPEKVTLKPKETKEVPVAITMPDESFDGYLSGGIYIQKTETDEEKKASEGAKGVVNKYAFIVGILLSETDTKVQPELSFNKINAGLTNYRNAFLIDFSNTRPTYVEGMTVDAQIMKKGSDEVLYESKKENYRMAPNSSIVFPVNLNGEAFAPGDYVGRILVTVGDKKWEWKEEFSITKQEADKYNTEDVSLVQDRGINWKMILLIVGGILGLLLVIYLIIHQVSKNNKKSRRKKERKKA